MIEGTPYIEPLVSATTERRWAVLLVNRRTARLLTGSRAALSEQLRATDNVHGQHEQGGFSQANYERSIEKDTDDHLRRAAGGALETITALNERRVGVLLLEERFDQPAARCPSCGLLVLDGDGRCPIDATGLEQIDHLREAAVEAAVAQDAGVMIVSHYPDLGPFRGIAALLRF